MKPLATPGRPFGATPRRPTRSSGPTGHAGECRTQKLRRPHRADGTAPYYPTEVPVGPPDGLPNADAITERALSLTAHHALSSDDLGYMVEVVGEELAAL